MVLGVTCNFCIWMQEIQVPKEVKYKKFDEERKKKKKKSTEVKLTSFEQQEIERGIFCNKYQEKVANASRAERCKYYTRRGSIPTLDAYTQGDHAIEETQSEHN